MAIIYSYPANTNILATDIILGSSTVIVNGKRKNQTKSFEVADLATYFASVMVAPTLQEVILSGNDTTNAFTASDTNSYGFDSTVTGFESIGMSSVLNSAASISYSSSWLGYQATIYSVDNVSGQTRAAYVQDTGMGSSWQLGFQTGAIFLDSGSTTVSPNLSMSRYLGKSFKLKIDNLTDNKAIVLQVPNKVTGTYTIATTADIPIVTGFVPYTGANQSVNLGAYNLTVNSISVGRGSGSGADNTAVGFQSLSSNTTGTRNVANGYRSLRYNTTGSNNVATGYEALLSNTTGEGNVANGFWSLRSNTTGSQNAANGYQSLYANTTGNNNVVVGYQALRYNTTGSNNAATGTQSLYNNTTGDSNISYGISSLYNNTTGNFNTGVGRDSLKKNTVGISNAAFGNQALLNNIIGSENVAIGNTAGSVVFGGTANETPNSSVFIGAGTKSKTNADSNQIVIGYNAIGDGSNTARIGNTSTTALYVGGAGAGVVLKSPNGTSYKITVSNIGVITATAI